MSMEKLDKRFGVIAVEKGFITSEQLIESMKTQILEDLEDAKHRLIGQILFEKRYMTNMQIKEVLKTLGV